MANATKLTPEEIQQYRKQFQDYPEALNALNIVDESDRILDDAAEIIAIETGLEQATLSSLDEQSSYLDKVLEKLRTTICSQYTDDALELFKELREFVPFPASLIALVSIRVSQVTIREFCNRNNSNDQ